MPPKKKEKKGVHEHPEKPPSLVRKQAGEMKLQLKKSRRALKKLMKDRKRSKGKYREDEESGSEIEGEESELQEDNNLPQSSGNKASTSRSLEEAEEDNSQKKRYNKWGKKIKSKKPPVTSIKSKKGRKNEDSEFQESASFSSSKPSTSHSVGQEVDLQRKKNKWSKKSEDDLTPLLEKSSFKPKSMKGRKWEESWLQESATFCSDKATTCTSLGQEVDFQQKKNKWSKKTGDDPTAQQEKSSVKSKKSRKSEEIWLPELATFSSDTATTSSFPRQEVNLQQKKTNKASKKIESSPTPLQKQSSIKLDSDIATSPKNIAEKKQLTNDVAETGNVYSQVSPLNRSSDKKLLKVKPVQTQVKAEKKSGDKETLKCTKILEPKDNAQNVGDILQQESEKSEADTLSFDPSLLEEKGTAVIGDIKIIPKGRIGKRKSCTYSRYDENEKTIYIGDENVEISILVLPGTQVVCNTRRCPGIDLVQSARNFSGGFDDHATARPDQEINADSKYRGNLASNTKSNSEFVSEVLSQYCEAGGDQATYIQDINTIEASEQHGKNATDTKSDLSSLGKFSNESDSSTCEKLQKIQEAYLKTIKSVSEKLLLKVENQVKANLSKTSKM